MDGPLSKAADRLIEDLIEELPRRTTVAILSVYSNDPAASSYALEKIEQRFYDARHFSIIEKRFIDDVRRDKRLQESDDIDQAKAVELAREEGWNVVVIGEISGSGSSRRLTLRAIDAEKATILSRAMENF
jgi:predicted Fe-Mo cluster-binding NifX family protein